MISVNVLIVEDNPEVILTLETLVRSMGCNIAGIIDNADEVLSFIYNTTLDLIFMNIDIKGKCSGFELARRIRSLHIPVIHIPAFDPLEEPYENGWFNPVQSTFFKPDGKLTLYASMALATYGFRNGRGNQYAGSDSSQHESECKLTDSIFIKKGYAFCKVCFKDILYVKADGNYCEIQTTEEKFIHKITLTQLINSLPKRHFLKIHRSYVVYIHHIRKFSPSRNSLTVGNYVIPFGKGYKTTLLNSLRKI